MTTRTDTERFEWMKANAMELRGDLHGDPRWVCIPIRQSAYLAKDIWCFNPAEAIDAAMDAAESAELDEAWMEATKQFKASHWFLRYWPDDGGWNVYRCDQPGSFVSFGYSADAAVLAAYRASKKG